MDLTVYQNAARETVQMDISTPIGRIELVMGLTSEVGGLARIYKRLIRDEISLGVQAEQLVESIGDVLWYVSMVARSVDLDLNDVGERNLSRIHDRYASLSPDSRVPSSSLPDFDSTYPSEEQFPRKMIFRLDEICNEEGMPHVGFIPVEAFPNPFPAGKYKPVGANKAVGFTLGQNIGDVVNDNSGRDDGYRYHDAVHVAFMAVLGWSPVLRGLLRLKRKSNEEVDRVEDGARARDLEEALSAILAEMSRDRNNFASLQDIGGEVRDVIRQVVSNLEVARAPVWLWSEAIHQGYVAMNLLRERKGGYLLADRDARTVTYYSEDEPPASLSSNSAS